MSSSAENLQVFIVGLVRTRPSIVGKFETSSFRDPGKLPKESQEKIIDGGQLSLLWSQENSSFDIIFIYNARYHCGIGRIGRCDGAAVHGL